MGEKVQLVYRFTKGKELLYRGTSIITKESNEQQSGENRQTIRNETNISFRALEIEADGSIHIISRIIPHSQEINGETKLMQEQPHLVYMQITPQGKITETTGLPVLPAPLIFPETPVLQGDEWEDESVTMIQGIDKPIQLINRFRLEEIISRNSTPCAKISTYTDETSFEISQPGISANLQQIVSSRGEVLFHLDGYILHQSAIIHAIMKQRDLVMEVTNRVLLEILQ